MLLSNYFDTNATPLQCANKGEGLHHLQHNADNKGEGLHYLQHNANKKGRGYIIYNTMLRTNSLTLKPTYSFLK